MDAHTTENEENIPFHGAGIVPYMVRCHAAAQETLLLLGQEDFYPHWNQSGCWSGFEGGRKGGESEEDTAAREFVEETMGTIPVNGHVTRDEIAQSLRDSEFAFRIDVTRGRLDAPPFLTRRHVVFLVRIEWNEHIASGFTATRNALAALCTKCTARDTATSREQHSSTVETRVREIETFLAGLPDPVSLHPAILSRGDPKTVNVHPDYLEKREVRLVSLSSLRALVTCRKQRYGRAHRGRIKLRYIFVPTIRAIIDVFDQAAGEVAMKVSGPS